MFKLNSILLLIFLLAACKSSPEKKSNVPDTLKRSGNKTVAAKEERDTLKDIKAEPGEELLYQDGGIATFVDSKKRGTGVISFQLDVNKRLDIYDEDGSEFGFIVLNEDFSYFTLNMPEKVVARKVVPTYDFAAFDFDAEPVSINDEYLRIYVNKKLRKVKKAGAKYTYSDWAQYSKYEKDDSEDAENQ
ncbi:hypothetical protein [Mucilaginibacter sp.]|uniref:hypothetical protein n=1 Tax=Mucilaginibacter sp. TaxID=1882438 RepID=UPI0035BBC8A6